MGEAIPTATRLSKTPLSLQARCAMTVQELIDKLLHEDPNAEVLLYDEEMTGYYPVLELRRGWKRPRGVQLYKKPSGITDVKAVTLV